MATPVPARKSRKKCRLATADPVDSAVLAGLRYISETGPGISRKRSGHGFRYIDPRGKPILDKKELARIQALVIPPAWTSVWICPSANGHIQAVGRDAKGRKQYRYHARYRKVRDRVKFHQLTAFCSVLPKVRRRSEPTWRSRACSARESGDRGPPARDTYIQDQRVGMRKQQIVWADHAAR
jgi:DNA topoisomerase-1